MAKLTLSNLANLDNPTTAVNTINNNSDLIETALENTLSRDGTVPNQMQADLDMNQKNVINANTIFATTISAVNYIGGSSTVVNSSNLEFVSIAALRAYTTTPLVYGNSRVVSWYPGQNEGGGLFYYDSSDTTSADNGGTIIIDGLGRRWKRPLDEQIDVTMFGTKGDGATDDSTAIQAAITAAGVGGGGIVFFPAGTYAIASTLVINTANVFLNGYGADFRHLAGAQFAEAATMFKWTGANLGTMVQFISPSGAGNNKMIGGGLSGISFDANSLAGIGLDIQSRNSGRFENLQFHEFLTVAINLDVVATLSDVRDDQENIFSQIYIWQSAQNGIGLRLQATTAGANPSLNTFQRVRVQHKDGNGIELHNSDNNHFIDINIARTAGGTGEGLILNGSNVAAAYVARSNVFDGLVYPNFSPISKGTASFTYPAYDNSFLNLDADNNTLIPTVEAGSYIGQLTWKSGESRETTIASAATTDLGASPSERVGITGTASITSFGTVKNRRRYCRSADAHTLVHNATSLILPGGANILCAVNDTWVAESGSTGNWRVKQFTRASEIHGAATSGREAITYSTSMTPNQNLGSAHTIAITDGVAFTINNPINCVDGSIVSIRIRNGSGVAHGAITWGAGYKMAGALPAIATGFNRTIMFEYNGTSWFETFRSAADVAN